MKSTLIQKLRDKAATIGIIGLGYVGIPLARLYLQNGFRVYGFDIDQTKIEALKKGQKYIEHLDAKCFQSAYESGDFLPTTDYARSSEVDALIFCVPTPLDEHREPDLSYVIQSLESVLPFLKPGQVISLESTTYPGTTNEELRPRIEAKGPTIGIDCFLVYSPEREDPNNPNYTTYNIPKVCGGETPECLEVGTALYEGVIQTVVPVSSTQAAEMTKILENTFRAVNIALVNELKIVAHKMGIDIFEVIRAAATKPFGYMPFYPGPGLGGHCIPIDPFYLTWKAREYNVHTRFIELAGEVNTSMPDYVIGRVMEALNEHGKPVKDSKILVLGVAYKKNVDDMRESPSLEIMDRLMKMGAHVDYSDPHVQNIPKLRKFNFKKSSIYLSPDKLRQYDLALILTDHDAFDWESIQENATCIVDASGRFLPNNGKVFIA